MIFAAFIIVLPVSPPVRGIPDEPLWTLDWVGVAIFLGLFAAAIDAAQKAPAGAVDRCRYRAARARVHAVQPG